MFLLVFFRDSETLNSLETDLILGIWVPIPSTTLTKGGLNTAVWPPGMLNHIRAGRTCHHEPTEQPTSNKVDSTCLQASGKGRRDCQRHLGLLTFTSSLLQPLVSLTCRSELCTFAMKMLFKCLRRSTHERVFCVSQRCWNTSQITLPPAQKVTRRLHVSHSSV